MPLTPQRSATVCLDEEHRPLRPAISWLDQRRTGRYPAVPFWLEAGFRIIGMKAAIHFFRSKAECNWLAANEPDLWRQTRHFLFLSGYLTFRLTGRVCEALLRHHASCCLRSSRVASCSPAIPLAIGAPHWSHDGISASQPPSESPCT